MHLFLQLSCNFQLYIKRGLQDLVIAVQNSTVRYFVWFFKKILFIYIVFNCNNFDKAFFYCTWLIENCLSFLVSFLILWWTPTRIWQSQETDNLWFFLFVSIVASTWEIRNLNTSTGSNAPRSLVTQMLEIHSSCWFRWKKEHSSKFEKSVPYALLCQVAGLLI